MEAGEGVDEGRNVEAVNDFAVDASCSSVRKQTNPSLWSGAGLPNYEWTAVINAGCSPSMRSRDAKIGQWRHLLLQCGPMAAPTILTFAKGAADSGAILSDPDQLSEICSRMLNSRMTIENVIMMDEKRNKEAARARTAGQGKGPSP